MMRSSIFLITLLYVTRLTAQNDSSIVVKQDNWAVTKFSRHPYPRTSDVCRNDTVWLYDWQYDSVRYYVHRGLDMNWHTHGTHVDTTIKVGKESFRRNDFHGWLQDWMYEWWSSRYYFIYFDTGELHMTFQETGEGHMGELREYYKDGTLKCNGSYCPDEVGARYGIWNWYDEEGNLIRTKNYKGDKYCTGEKKGYRRFTLYRRKFDFF